MYANLSFPRLATNIYGSDARFIFELLQNADDNRYTRARAEGADPFISFCVYPDRIIVECNEDGFTVKDLSAICSVGESTKSTSHGYIGAKGIGFKSVFIAASKVYIQSGHFSFFFKHAKGDSALSMGLPIWKETDEELPGPLTRMTLHLHEVGDREKLEHVRKNVYTQLSELQQTCLLFLRNLKKIKVNFYDEDGEETSSRAFSIGNIDDHRVFLKAATKMPNCKPSTETRHYHLTRHVATGLPRSDNRELPDLDDSNTSSSTSEIILAFPITSDSCPIISGQDIFAFLPIRYSSFKVSWEPVTDTPPNDTTDFR